MEIEENYVDEILDLNPLLYSNGQGLMSSDHPSSSPRLISFENSNTHHILDYNILEIQKFDHSQIIKFSSNKDDDSSKNPNPYDHEVTPKWVSTTTRTRSQAQDHLMAERKRRHNLTQLFITLSKLVPGLRKLDKASLLEDAIKYLKALEERVSDLEREDRRKKSCCLYEESKTMNYNNIGSTSKQEINVRIAERHVLVKIHCKKQLMEMIMSRIPCEIEKMNLNVIDIRMMPFGGESLDVTILAEVQSEFGGTVKDIVNHLQAVFLEFANIHP